MLALEQLLNGLQFGVMLFLLAAGLTLVFGIMGLLNLAHGSLYMVGAFAAAYAMARTGSFIASATYTSMGTFRSRPAARICPARPIRRKISIVRALHRSIFGRNSGAGLFSIKAQRTPRRPRSMASVSPTGPAPTTRTSVFIENKAEHLLHFTPTAALEDLYGPSIGWTS